MASYDCPHPCRSKAQLCPDVYWLLGGGLAQYTISQQVHPEYRGVSTSFLSILPIAKAQPTSPLYLPDPLLFAASAQILLLLVMPWPDFSECFKTLPGSLAGTSFAWCIQNAKASVWGRSKEEKFTGLFVSLTMQSLLRREPLLDQTHVSGT